MPNKNDKDDYEEYNNKKKIIEHFSIKITHFHIIGFVIGIALVLFFYAVYYYFYIYKKK